MPVTPNYSQSEFSTSGGYLQGFIAPGDFLLQKEVRDAIFDTYDEATIFDWLIQSKRAEVSANTEFNWYEQDPIYQVATVESKAGSAGAGNPVTITLEEADHLDSGARSLFSVNDIIEFYTATGNFKAYVTATNKTVADAHTVTAVPVDAAVDLVTAVAAADLISLISNAHADGTDQPESKERKPVRRTATTQIIKSSFKVTASESANRSEVTVQGKPYWYFQGVQDKDLRHRLAIDYHMLIGPSGSVTDPETSEAAYLSDSVESVAEERGNSSVYTTFDLAAMKLITAQMSLENQPKENVFWTGNNLDVAIDDYFRGLNDQGSIVYTNWGNGMAGERAIDYGFDSFRYNSYTFHKQNMRALNSKSVTGYTGSPYPDMGFIMPLGTFTDAQSGKVKDTLTLMTKANDMHNRAIRTDFKDNFKLKGGNDSYIYDSLSEVGLRLACGNWIYKVSK